MNRALRIPLSWMTLLLLPSLLLSQQMSSPKRSAPDTIAYIIQHTKKAEKQCDALFELGRYYFNVGEAESTFLTMTKCLAIAKMNNYEKRIYDAYAMLGSVYLKGGDFNKSRSIFQECLQIANLHHSDYGANRAYYLLASIYYQQGLMDSVIFISKKYLKLLALFMTALTFPGSIPYSAMVI